MDSVKGRDSGCYTINGFAQTLQVWVYTALPELGATYVFQLEDFPDDLIIIHIFYLLQTRVINFVQKDIDQMFPKWEFDVEDTPAENIIKLMFHAVVSLAKKNVVKENRKGLGRALRRSSICRKGWKLWIRRLVSPQKGKGHHLKTLPLHLNRRSNPGCICFVSCMSEHVCFVYMKVLMGRTREGRAWRRIKVQMCPQFCPQMLVPRKIKLQNRALRRMLDIRKRGMLLWHFFVQRVIEQGNLVIIPNKKLYPGYNHFAPIDKKKLKELADWLKTCPHYRTPLDKKSLVYIEDLPHIDAWINVLRKRYDVNPQYFRSEIMCFLDHLFAQQWRFNFKDFGDSEPDQNGTIPSFCQSNKKHIVVFDSICSIISPEELDVVMEPFVYMVPYLLVECASSDEQRAQYSLEPFTYERPTNIPPARACDCGVYTLKARPSQICLVVQFDKEVDTDKFITQIFNT
ncbi:unnamed protein product [Brassica oleracea var. botrytis]